MTVAPSLTFASLGAVFHVQVCLVCSREQLMEGQISYHFSSAQKSGWPVKRSALKDHSSFTWPTRAWHMRAWWGGGIPLPERRRR